MLAPSELTNLRNIRTLPRVLAAFLGVPAAGAIAHVLATSVRRRRRDLATLRALGMTKGAVRAILNTQGRAIALVGLVVGIPLGWRPVGSGGASWPLKCRSPSSAPWRGRRWSPSPGRRRHGQRARSVAGRRAASLRPAEVLREE